MTAHDNIGRNCTVVEYHVIARYKRTAYACFGNNKVRSTVYIPYAIDIAGPSHRTCFEIGNGDIEFAVFKRKLGFLTVEPLHLEVCNVADNSAELTDEITAVGNIRLTGSNMLHKP